jgi:hypothetical protein
VSYVPVTQFVTDSITKPVRPVPRFYETTVDGLTVTVKGWLANGNVEWYEHDPFNVKAVAEAQAKARFDAAVRAKDSSLREANAEAAKLRAKLNSLEAEKAKREEAGRSQQPIGHNFGLGIEHLGKRKDSYTAHSTEAKRFVAEATAPSEDVTKLHLTIIGQDADRAAVLNDIKSHPAFEGLRDRLLVQDYKPGEWAIDPSLGFRQDGKPTIVIQEPKGPHDPKGGRVLWRSKDYRMGPEGLAEAIRKADPDYRPDKDPGPANGPMAGMKCPLGFTRAHRSAVFVAGLIVYLVLKRKGGQ